MVEMNSFKYFHAKAKVSAVEIFEIFLYDLCNCIIVIL